jgi:hypothetical protein
MVLDRSDDAVLGGAADREYAALQISCLEGGEFAAAGTSVGGEPGQQGVLLGPEQVEHALPGAWLFGEPGAGLSTASSAVAISWWTCSGCRCWRGCGPAGACMPSRGSVMMSLFRRPQVIAECRTRNRASTTAGVSPAWTQRAIARSTVLGVIRSKRARLSRSRQIMRPSPVWVRRVVGIHSCGLVRNVSSSSRTVMRALCGGAGTTCAPYRVTSSRCRIRALASSPWWVNDFCMLAPVAGSEPTLTRISHTPGRRSRRVPPPRADRRLTGCRADRVRIAATPTKSR